MAGQIVCDLAPGKGNPRNSEGAFIKTKTKEILFCYTGYEGDSFLDHATANICCIRSTNQGLTWSEPRIIVTTKEHQAMNVMSVSLLELKDGQLGLFYLVRKTFADLRVWLRRSSDGGKTWGEARCCTTRMGYFVMNNDRVLRLSSGRIILPVAEHQPTFPPGSDYPHYSPAYSTFFYSDDEGHTWHETQALVALSGTRSDAGLQEPGVLEMTSGMLYAWARTDLGCQFQFMSLNGGCNWSAAVPSCFTSPLSPLSMKRLKDGRLLAIWNPIPTYLTRKYHQQTGGRTPLIAALSENEGQHWQGPIILEDDPDSGYCYTAIYELRDALLLGYCAGNVKRDGACLNRLRIRRIPLKDLDSAVSQQTFYMRGIGF
ncbi:MAG: exo-alpha-sialidase [Clostridiales bacterium]|nr:exo-alpha-sialidase [Clostridiales bacterium]